MGEDPLWATSIGSLRAAQSPIEAKRDAQCRPARLISIGFATQSALHLAGLAMLSTLNQTSRVGGSWVPRKKREAPEVRALQTCKTIARRVPQGLADLSAGFRSGATRDAISQVNPPGGSKPPGGCCPPLHPSTLRHAQGRRLDRLTTSTLRTGLRRTF